MAKVKDIVIELNTGDKYVAKWTSDLISNKLEAVIIENDVFFDVHIASELGYDILKIQQHLGNHYIPITISPLSPQGHKRNFQSNNFYLNEKIIINAIGQKNHKIKIILRLCID